MTHARLGAAPCRVNADCSTQPKIPSISLSASRLKLKELDQGHTIQLWAAAEASIQKDASRILLAGPKEGPETLAGAGPSSAHNSKQRDLHWTVGRRQTVLDDLEADHRRAQQFWSSTVAERGPDVSLLLFWLTQAYSLVAPIRILHSATFCSYSLPNPFHRCQHQSTSSF